MAQGSKMGKEEVVKHIGKTQQPNKGVSLFENRHIPSINNMYVIMTKDHLANEAEQGQDLQCSKMENGSNIKGGGIQERIVPNDNLEHRIVQEGTTEQGEMGYKIEYNVQKGTIQDVSNIECPGIEEMTNKKCGDNEQGTNAENNNINDKFNKRSLPQSRGNSTKQRKKIIISTIFAVILTLCLQAVPSVYFVNMKTQQGGLSKYIPLWWSQKEILSHVVRFSYTATNVIIVVGIKE